MLKWRGKKFAVSLTFDDAYPEHLHTVCPALENNGLKGTFYVGMPGFLQMASKWKLASERGHEIGNHTVFHPGPRNGNFTQVSLEGQTMDDMEWEVDTAGDIIKRITGKEPVTFAYPFYCHYIGEGINASSYYPVIAENFLASRMYRSSDTNSFSDCNLHALTSFPLDGITYSHYEQIMMKAEAEGGWVIFDSHRVKENEVGQDSTNVDLFMKVLADLTTRKDAFIGTVEEIAGLIFEERIQAQAGRVLVDSTPSI